MIVDMACLYTSCECPSRRSSTQKLSNQVTTPCNLTPLTRKIVSGVLFLRTWFRKVSWRFCERSAAIVVVPFLARGPLPACLYCQAPVPLFVRFDSPGLGLCPLQGTRWGGASGSWRQKCPFGQSRAALQVHSAYWWKPRR